MKKYNLTQLVSVKVLDKCISKDYKFLPYEKIKLPYSGGFYEQIGGIYETILYDGDYKFVCDIYCDNIIFKECSFEDHTKIIYVKPRLSLIFSNNDSVLLYFDSIEEAEEKYFEIETANYQWLSV